MVSDDLALEIVVCADSSASKSSASTNGAEHFKGDISEVLAQFVPMILAKEKADSLVENCNSERPLGVWNAGQVLSGIETNFSGNLVSGKSYKLKLFDLAGNKSCAGAPFDSKSRTLFYSGELSDAETSLAKMKLVYARDPRRAEQQKTVYDFEELVALKMRGQLSPLSKALLLIPGFIYQKFDSSSEIPDYGSIEVQFHAPSQSIQAGSHLKYCFNLTQLSGINYSVFVECFLADCFYEENKAFTISAGFTSRKKKKKTYCAPNFC